MQSVDYAARTQNTVAVTFCGSAVKLQEDKGRSLSGEDMEL